MTEMKKPKKGKKPERIKTDNPPGGPHTPGAKKKKKKKTYRKTARNYV